MDFKQIEAFVNVAKYKSFSKAADAIFLSQPTISAHISSLEQELCMTLFDRTGKEIKLTPAGSVFIDYAIDMVNMRNNAVLSLSDFNSKVSGKISIASSSTPCRFLLPEFIKSFYNIFDNVNFDIKEDNTKKVVDMILSSEADIGIVGEVISDSRLSYTKIADDDLVLISNDKNLQDILSIKELFSLKFILRDKGSATLDVFQEILLKYGYSINKLNIITTINSLEGILQFVKNSLGVSVVSRFSCIDYINSGLIREHEIEGIKMKRGIYAVKHNKRTLSPAAKEFYNHIIQKK